MRALVALAARRPVAMVVLALAAVLVGYRAWGLLPVDLLPDLESPTVVVSLRSGDRPPLEMERLYGEQVEQRLFTVRGIRRISQVARSGRLLASVVFGWDADMDLALIEVQKAIAPLGADPNVDEVLVRRFDPRQLPVVTVGLVAPDGQPGLAELRRVARRRLAPALERLEGVAEVRVVGGRKREVRVALDPHQIETHGLTLELVESRLRAANLDINAGTLEEGDKVYLVRGLQRFRTPRDVSSVVLTYVADAGGRRLPLRLGDVAEVSESDAEISHLVRVNGTEGVGLSVYKEAGANTVEVSRALTSALEGLQQDLPGVEFRTVSDDAAVVEQSIGEVEQAALIGILLAVAVLFIFLRSAGATLIVSATIPVSLLATVFFMHLSGRSLNVMTLAGLALGAGMLVDNAIVVVEAIYRRLFAGDPAEEGIVAGTGEVAGAILGSTLTTCVVFLPVLFVRGLAARLIAGLSFTVIAALLCSLVSAVLLIPALGSWLLPRTRRSRGRRARAAAAAVVGRLVRRPLTVVLLALLLTAGAVTGLTRLGTELLPPSDPRQFALRLVTRPGQRVEATARVAAAVEQILRQAAGDDLEAVLAEVGRLPEDDRQIRQEQTEENTARLQVRLRTGGRGAAEVVAAAREAVEALDGVSVQWEVGNSAFAQALGQSGPPLAIEISGRSLEDLRGAARVLRKALAAQPELWNVRSTFEGGPPELHVVLDRSLADGLGVSADAVARTLEASLDGRAATKMTRGDEELEVRLHLPPPRRDELADLTVTTGTGRRVPLGQVASFELAEGAREIHRRDQRRVALVTARIAPGVEYPQALGALRRVMAEHPPAEAVSLKLAGEEEERSRAVRELRDALILALVLVFMVLAGQFESLLHPFTVLSSVPLALTGVAAVMVPLGWPLGVMALLGLVLLAGVAVNDAILLVDTAERFRSQGKSAQEAAAEAAGVRLRPILMTTLTTVLAMAPLALGVGEAARLRAPLALTVIGGLLGSTLASLLVIPCIYVLFDRLRPPRRER